VECFYKSSSPDFPVKIRRLIIF